MMFWLMSNNKILGSIEIHADSYVYTGLFYSKGEIRYCERKDDKILFFSNKKRLTYTFYKSNNGIYTSQVGNNLFRLIPKIKFDGIRKKLRDVTLICVDGKNPIRSTRSIEICKNYCEFEDIKLISSIDFNYKHHIKTNIDINSKNMYSWFLINKIHEYCETKNMLIVQHDGWICNPLSWKNEWLDIDYIGADISHSPRGFKEGGNGGFSLRTKSLMKFVSSISVKYKLQAEDKVICSKMVDEIKMNGFILSNDSDFSVDGKLWTHQFGFHKSDSRLWVNPFI